MTESNKVIIYGRSVCTQCEQAKIKLFRNKIDFDYLMYDEDGNKETLQQQYDVLPRTLPIITYKDKVYSFFDVDNLIKLIKA